ncbi:MAG: hypothetical protein RL497_293, partial [Pseudomonadota bacterium]
MGIQTSLKIISLFFLFALTGCEGSYNTEDIPPLSANISAPTNNITGLPLKVTWTVNNITSCTVRSDSQEAAVNQTIHESGSIEFPSVRSPGVITFRLECEQIYFEIRNTFLKTIKVNVHTDIATSARIPKKGGSVVLNNFAEVQFPADSIDNRDVVVSKIESKDNDLLF